MLRPTFRAVSLLGLAALVGTLALPLGSVAAATTAPSSVLPSPHGAQVMLVPLGVATPHRPTRWRAMVSFECKDQTVDGSFDLAIGRNGTFEHETSALNSESDEGSETSTTLRGHLGTAGAQGTIDAYARAYDADGTTAECTKHGIPWKSFTAGGPEAPRVEAVLAVPADAITAGAGVLYVTVETKATDTTRVRVLDPATNAFTRTLTIKADLNDLVASADALWGVTNDGHVLRIDPADGRVTATADAHASGIAVSGTSVWAAGDGGVVRIDAATGAVAATVPLPGRAHGQITAAPNGTYVEFEAIDHNPDGSLQYLYASIDPATNTVVTTVPAVPDEGAGGLAADARGLWTVGGSGPPTIHWAPRTLVAQHQTPFGGYGVVIAAPGAWVGIGSGITALDDNGAVAFSQPIVGADTYDSELANLAGSVWVIGDGALVRLRAG
jgi:hypothetical protein